MIRTIENKDTNKIMEIWLKSTIKAHDFIPKEYWEANFDLVKDTYIPMSDTFIYEDEEGIKGFISIINNEFIGALFVGNDYQGGGIGSKLIQYVCDLYNNLTLAVYKDNTKSVEFYKKMNFEIISEGINEDSKYVEYTMKYSNKPQVYKQTEVKFWDDEYISKQMLKAHLDPDFDGATRKLEFIEKSVDWISKVAPPNKHTKLLDLGCGPGIYAKRFFEKGYIVKGIDYSKRSIEYAQSVAKEKNLNIDFLYKNYLDLDYKNEFDLVTLIYCDYGVLSSENRMSLAKKVYDSLKPGGKFILDVFASEKFNIFEECKTREVVKDGGFWSNEEYLCLNGNYKYEDKTILEQVAVITKDDTKIYYIWNHCFTKDSLLSELKNIGFKSVEFFGNIAGDDYTEDSLTMAIILEK
ncbi:N-acetyltransferase [Romboutsia weinsteinii]|uniref:N-acetyltransferase n=1 Tax=Romboutsia weinsteinii TaxID=2020949 RepID=A0A371J4I3_9FIRM|nr:N-acetyltransferase [Romboutsia weinsteinii]RDY27690.1 N-acetyltransferase [Romboutsia weinsteinii]